MIETASHLATTNIPSDLIPTLIAYAKSSVTPALLTAAAAVVLMMFLLSADQLFDTSKPMRQRLRSAPISKLVPWLIIGWSAGISCFTIALFAQVVALYTEMSIYESALFVFVGIAVFCLIMGGIYYAGFKAFEKMRSFRHRDSVRTPPLPY